MRGAWLALGLVSAAVLFAFDTPVTLAIGVAGLLAFVGLGVTLIASPGFLAADDDERP